MRPGELAAAGGLPCPRRLPGSDDASGGLGTEQPAEEVPSLLGAQEAWVCRYDAVELGLQTNDPTRYAWRRAGRAEPVAPADLRRLEAALDDLAPADGDRACTAELGPRWLVVSSHGGDLTGVLVDDYGCRDVRLTDDPHGTPAGADGQDGTVGGVLDGGPAVLGAVGVGRQR